MVSGLGTYARRPLLAALLLVAACSESPELPDTECVQITAAIEDQTRTSMSGSSASFISGDKIGVFETLTGRSNVAYTLSSNTWSTPTPMYWYNGTANHTFYAYYPYNASNTGLRVGIPVLSGQTISTSPAAALDMLVTNPIVQKRAASAALSFTHAFALIQLNIKMGILQLLNPYYLNRITIQGGNTSGGNYGIVNISGNPAQVGYDLSAKAVWAATNDAQSFAQSFYSDIPGISLTTTSITLYAFVLPGTYSNPAPAISFRITTLGITRNTPFLKFSNATFAAGTKYVYDVSIGLLNRAQSPAVMISTRETVPYGDTTIGPINQ